MPSQNKYQEANKISLLTCAAYLRFYLSMVRFCARNGVPHSFWFEWLTDVLASDFPPSKSLRRSLPISLASKGLFGVLVSRSQRDVWSAGDRTRKEPAPAPAESDDRPAQGPALRERRTGKRSAAKGRPAGRNWPKTTAKRADPTPTRLGTAPGTKREANRPNGRRAALLRRPASSLAAKPKNNTKNINTLAIMRRTKGGWVGFNNLIYELL